MVTTEDLTRTMPIWGSVEDNYVVCWSDNSQDVRELVRSLKDCRVRAKTSHSPYVGHRTLAVHHKDLRAAVKCLKYIGEENVAEGYEEWRKYLQKVSLETARWLSWKRMQ